MKTYVLFKKTFLYKRVLCLNKVVELITVFKFDCWEQQTSKFIDDEYFSIREIILIHVISLFKILFYIITGKSLPRRKRPPPIVKLQTL